MILEKKNQDGISRLLWNCGPHIAARALRGGRGT